MILGAGIDVVEIARFERALARNGARLIARVFTEHERRACEGRAHGTARLALRFAAKEAAMKALGTGWAQGVAWQDFETTESGHGLALEIRGRARELATSRGLRRAWIGGSYTRTHALAHVVLEGAESTGAP